VSHRVGAIDRADPPTKVISQPAVDTLAPRTWLWVCVATTVAVWTALYLAQRLASQFFADDFLYLQLARIGHLDLQWLAVDNYGHFAPLTRLAYLVVQRRVHLDYAVAAILPATLGTLLFLALLWIGRQLLGARPASVLLALAGATSLPVLRVVQWWGAAVHVLGAAVCMSVCVAAFIALVRSGRWRYAVLSVTALAVGLLIQERPLLTIGYLVLIRYLFFPPQRTGATARWISREIVLWAPYVVVLTVYLTYRLFFFASSPEPGDLGQGMLFTASGFERSFLPSLVGIRLGGTSGWFEPAAAAGWLVLIGAGIAIAIHRRSAWKAVAFLAATYLANAGMLAAGRLGVADAIAQSRDLQYFVDPCVATVMAAMLGLGALPSRNRPGATTEQFFRLAVPTASVAIAIATVTGWSSYMHSNNQTAAHRYLGEALPRLSDRSAAPYDLLRLRMPRDVAPGFLDPWTDQPGIFTLAPGIERRLDPLATRKLAVLPDGDPVAVHPARIERITSSDISESSKMRTVERGASGTCVTGPPSSVLAVALAAPVESEDLFYEITYSSPKPLTVHGATNASGSTFYNFSPTQLPAGENVTVLDRLDGHTAERLYLVFGPRLKHMCVHSVWLGKAAAEGPEGCRVLDHDGRFTAEKADCSTDWPG
jgi:hypothetical protein